MRIATPSLGSLATFFLAAACLAQAGEFQGERAQELVADLGAPYPSVSALVAEKLLAAGGQALPVLRLAVDEGNYRAREMALLVLAEIESQRIAGGQEPRYLDDLIRGLEDEAESVRRAAVRGLVYLGGISMEPVRDRLVERGGAALAYLREVEDTVMRRRVEEALASVISPDGSYGTYPGAFAHVGELGGAATAICMRIFGDPDYQAVSSEVRDNFITASKVRTLGGSALFEISGPEIVPDLRRMYDEAKADPGDPDRLRDFEANLATILSLQGEFTRFYRELSDLEEQALQAQSQWSSSASFIQADIADMYLKSHRNRSSVRWYLEASRESRTLNAPVHLYNVACAYSRMREKERALLALCRAVSEGYSQLSWMRKDGDLDYIRDEPEFKEIERILETGDLGALARLTHQLRSSANE